MRIPYTFLTLKKWIIRETLPINIAEIILLISIWKVSKAV